MKKRIEKKHLISAVVAAATVLSLGCLALADEVEAGSDADEQSEEIICVAEETAAVEADNAYTGWKLESGAWYYYKDGSYVTGWQEIGGKWYKFSVTGVMITGMHYDSSYKTSFIFGADGVMRTGWQECDGRWYYLNNNGYAQTGWQKISGKWYYFNESASNPYMYAGSIFKINDDWYMFDYDGTLLTGWQEYLDTYWYYFEPSSGKAVSGWKQLGGKYYYFDETSSGPRMVTSKVVNTGTDDNPAWYGFDKNGNMITSGWYTDTEVLVEYNGKKISLGNWYYFESNGKAAVGWKNISGKWYYFDEDGDPAAYTGVKEVNNKYYCFDYVSCEMRTGGWVDPYDVIGESSGRTYYIFSNGELATGWKKIGSDWYYFGKGNQNPYVRTGFVSVDGSPYYFDADGKMKTGWFKLNGSYFYADTTGVVIANRWKSIDGNWYYFNTNGKMATGLMKIDGKYYDFGTNGACLNP